LLLAGGLVAGSAADLRAGTLATEVDGVRVDLASRPEQPGTARQTEYSVRLSDAAGTPIAGARVTLGGRMADGMTVLAPLRPGREPGLYRGRVLFTMKGPWELTLRIAAQGRRFELPLIERVGR